MEIQNLKNYGKSLNEIMKSMPKEVEKGYKKISFKIIKKHLGIFNLIRFMLILLKEKKKMLRQDISIVRKKGLTDDKFIKILIDGTASFSAIAKITGKEKALEVFYEILDECGWDTMAYMFPALEDFKKFDDPLIPFKELFIGAMKANKSAGIHDFEVVEDTPDAFQVNVTYCVFKEIPELLGIQEAALVSCYNDDVYFPKICKQLGFNFKRTNTLARGGTCCDFRYER